MALGTSASHMTLSLLLSHHCKPIISTAETMVQRRI